LSTTPEIFDKEFDLPQPGSNAELARDEKGNLYLEDDLPKAFAFLVHIIYRGIITITEGTLELIPSVYFICEKLGLEELMNQIMDRIQEFDFNNPTHAFSVSELRHIYAFCRIDSKLWRYCLASIACRTIWGSLDERWTAKFVRFCRGSPEVAQDLFLMNFEYANKIHKHKADYRQQDNENGFAICEFHNHSSGQLCEKPNPKLSQQRAAQQEVVEEM
jgi:hypothetical protein